MEYAIILTILTISLIYLVLVCEKTVGEVLTAVREVYDDFTEV